MSVDTNNAAFQDALNLIQYTRQSVLLVQNTMQSTTAGCKLTLLIILGLKGLGTNTYPSLIRLKNHCE